MAGGFAAGSRITATGSRRGFTFDVDTLAAAGMKKAGYDIFALGL